MNFRMYGNLALFISFWLLTTSLLQAAEPSIVRESIRARGMGNAFTATANDQMVLFYNPAGLRSVNYNMYEAFGFNLTTNDNTIKLSSGSSGDTNSLLGEIAGNKIYTEINMGLLSHVNSRFGWSLFGNGLLDIQVRNPVFPYLETKAYVQGGLVAGIAWSFFDHALDFGLGAKIVNRSGVDSTFHIFDPEIIEVTNDEKTDKLEKKFESKTTFAPDAGIIYHFDGVHNLEPKIALSAQNISGLDFGAAGKVPMTLNLGVSTESELNGFDLILAADYRDLTDGQKLVSDGSIMTQRNFKFGLEVGLEKLYNGHHFFSFRLGRNGPYNSYGATLNLFGFKLDYARYSQEVGGYAGELEDKRKSFQLSFTF